MESKARHYRLNLHLIPLRLLHQPQNQIQQMPNHQSEQFYYKDGNLWCENVLVESLIEKVGTPTYIYSANTIRTRVRTLRNSLAKTNCHIYFAVKACSNLSILRLLAQEGCGADIVSGGELFRALKSGIDPQKIVFSGVGKSLREIAEAIDSGIHIFNVESPQEIDLINNTAKARGVVVNISLRVNPNIDAKTHPYISTGLKENKFGLDQNEITEIFLNYKKYSNLNFCGLSCHIGSQILSITPLIQSWNFLKNLSKLSPFNISHLDLGGGLGISYQEENEISLPEYGGAISHSFGGLNNFQIGIEPGRSIVGPAAILVSRILGVKLRAESDLEKKMLILDAGMNDLARPALYGAVHPAVPLRIQSTDQVSPVDLVGPICESADVFQRGAYLPPQSVGDFLAFGNAGAYGFSMSNQYNSRPRAAEVLVDDAQFQVIRRRESYSDLILGEII